MANCCESHTVATPEQPSAPQANHSRSRIYIEQMDCPTEERLIRDRLQQQPGIAALHFNVLDRVLLLDHEPQALEPALEAIRGLGFSPQLQTADQPVAEVASSGLNVWRLALAGLAAAAAEALHFAQWGPFWLVPSLALIAVLLCGIGTYRKGWIALKNRDLNINALMSLAVTGAILINQWPEAAMVMFLFALAEKIEARSLQRARNSIASLMSLAPEQARVLQADGQWQSQLSSEVVLGATVQVKPGERISLDGEVLEGRSTVNQAPITGESMPVEKAPGDAVYAGTINQAGVLLYRVTAPANQSTLAKIIHAVEQAQSVRAPTQQMVDRFSRIYTPAVVLLALLIALLGPWLMGGPALDWIYRALVLLVVACPCALVISTPVTVVSGLAAAARQGILVKGGVFLEQGRTLRYLALDKTGTVTHGKPQQTDVQLLQESESLWYPAVAASLASQSDHPVSQAMVAAAQQQGLELLAVEQFEALSGRGMRAVVQGRHYALGNRRLLQEQGALTEEVEARLRALEQQGKTVNILSEQGQARALFAVADTVKDSSKQAISELHLLAVKTLMLSGDNAYSVAAIAEQVGIDEARGNQLPEDKQQAIEQLAQQPGAVGMVGDGINDAPALAQADIGFAMAAVGSDSAIETADVAIMDDDLRKIPMFIRLSKQTVSILKQNMWLALGIKAMFVLLTISGQATLWMAVFADVGVSLLVIFNGLRLLRWKPAPSA